MIGQNDTICAQATAAGNGGIAILRISGPRALEIAGQVFFTKKQRKTFKPRYMYLGEVRSQDTLIDGALGVYFKAPHSYTGEDVFELHCHGGVMAAKQTLELLMQHGARPAQPGEFTKRAFLHGKMDISAAEAVADQIGALSEKGAQMAARQMQGELANGILDMQRTLTDILAEMEAGIEYPEDDLELQIAGDALPQLHALCARIAALHGSFRQGKLIREGIRVALAGRPNVGKSSLLNAIFGEERAIVSNIPGTTRDVISEHYMLHSLPIVFLDTAGVRDTGDVIERIGVERTHQAIDSAAVVVLVLDSSESLQQEDEQVYAYAKQTGAPVLIALNKADLQVKLTKEQVEKNFDAPVIEIAALHRTGIDLLLETLYQMAVGDQGLQEGMVITNSRHAFSLHCALQSLQDGIAALEAGIDLDCASIDLHDAWRYLGEITGQTLDEQIIDRIFEKFCLGK